MKYASRESLASQKPYIKYTFSFNSLLAPSSTVSNRPASVTPKALNNKTFFKKSYLLFTWFYYMRSALLKCGGSGAGTKFIKVATLPSRRRAYTLTKAPMAHKTNSKEQFMLKLYRFRVTFVTLLENSVSNTSLDQLILIVLSMISNFPTFETNLLLLKSSQLSFSSRLGRPFKVN